MDVYKMIPVKSQTNENLKRDLQHLTVSRSGRKTTYDDLINHLRSK